MSKYGYWKTEVRTITEEDGSVHHFGLCRIPWHLGEREIEELTRGGKTKNWKCFSCYCKQG